MSFFQGFKVKAIAIVSLVHVGFFAGVASLLTMKGPDGDHHPMMWTFLGVILAAYFATLIVTYFLLAPVAPWVQRAKQFSDWRSWFVRELPTILTLVPVVIAGVRAFKSRKKGQTPPLEKVGALISDLLNLEGTPPAQVRPTSRQAQAPKRRAPRPKSKVSRAAGPGMAKKSTSTRATNKRAA
jgi:hypothetical protein